MANTYSEVSGSPSESVGLAEGGFEASVTANLNRDPNGGWLVEAWSRAYAGLDVVDEVEALRSL